MWPCLHLSFSCSYECIILLPDPLFQRHVALRYETFSWFYLISCPESHRVINIMCKDLSISLNVLLGLFISTHKFWKKTNLSIILSTKPSRTTNSFTPKIAFSISPLYLPYNSHDVRSENIVFHLLMRRNSVLVTRVNRTDSKDVFVCLLCAGFHFRHLLGVVLEAQDKHEAASGCAMTAIDLEATHPIVPLTVIPRLLWAYQPS